MSDGTLGPGIPATPGTPPPGTSPAGPTRSTTFGPSALLTPANGITVIRLLATPVVIVLILRWGANWFTFVFGGLLAMSDGIDGWLARKQGTTRSGAFLDPLADKAVVLGALVALVAKGIVWWLPVAVIAVREVAMSIYRSVVGRHGISIPARNSAKFKTLVQDIAIGMCLAPPLAGHWTLLNGAMWVAAVLTVFTGAQYLVDGRRAAAERAAAGPAAVTRLRPGGLSGRARSRSWRSVPSSCSGRSPTPTRSGWVSSSPHSASRRTSTRPWGTTTSASSSPSAPHSPVATGSSCAAASDRPTTTSPGTRSPR